ncbi:MAG: hypothetical protein ABRQ24_08295, partial [Syntrophomonadaceae bacterium]
MGSITAIKRHPGEQTLINNMSAELQAILARVKTVEQQSAYLAEQISIHAERQIFMASALQESQAVAAEICSGAEQRIDSVTARARSMIEPQQARIIELNREIAGLEKEIPDQPPVAPANGIPTDLQIVPLSSHLDNIIELSAYTDPLHGWEEVEITAVAAVESVTDCAENTPAVIAEVAVEAEVPTPVSLAPPSSPNPASDHVSTPLDEDDGER